MPTTAPKDIQFTLKAKTPAFNVVEALQKQFSVTKTMKDGKETNTKLQGRILLNAFVESLLLKASEDTLTRLAEESIDQKAKPEENKASDYILAIHDAREITNPTPKKAAADMTIEELEAELTRKKAAQARGTKTKGISKV